MYPMIAEITGTTVVWIVAIFAAVVIALTFSRKFRKKMRAGLEILGILRISVSGSDEGATATDIETGGKLEVHATDGPAAAERVKAVGDVSVRSTAAGEGGESKKG